MVLSVAHLCEYPAHTNVSQAQSEITFVTTATDRFEAAYLERGYTQETLAAALGYRSGGAIGNALARGSLPKKLLEFEELTGIRAAWIRDGSGEKYRSPAGSPEPGAAARQASSITRLSPRSLSLAERIENLSPERQVLAYAAIDSTLRAMEQADSSDKTKARSRRA